MENNKVEIRDIHDEEFAILNPDGEEIYRGNNCNIFNDVRIQIMEKELDGYCVEFKDRTYPIELNGYVRNWPKGLCDLNEKQLGHILSLRYRKNKK